MKTENKFHIKNGIVAFFIFSMAYLVGLILWWQFYPYNPAEVEQPVTVIEESVEPGGTITMLVTVHKYLDVRADVENYIVCDNGGPYGAEALQGARQLPVGFTVRERRFKLDEFIQTPNVCTFVFDLKYEVNPIRKVNKVWVSEPFEVK